MKNKTILITGGSSGIGLEMAKFLVKLGNKVIVCGRSKERLENAKEQIPELVTIQCDITKSSDRETLHEKIIMQFGHLDMLINNAE
jgi:uncharacterized oxidoreductase